MFALHPAWLFCAFMCREKNCFTKVKFLLTNRKLSCSIRTFFQKKNKQNKNMHFTRLHWFTIKKKKKEAYRHSKREKERERQVRGEGMGVAILIQN